MRTRSPLVLAVSVLALTAAACDAGEGPTDEPPTAATTPSALDPAPTEEPAQEEAAAVDIDDFRFRPETITVAAGTEVTWTNQDDTRHTVTAGSQDDPRPEDFDLDVEAQGDEVSHTFDEPGTYDYFCELHPFMVAIVEVTG
jgi:plastocyanin